MYTCEICNSTFEKRQSLIGHSRIHTKKVRQRKPNSRKVLLQERRNCHDCRWCGQIFKSGISLGGHTTNCKQNPRYEENIERFKDLQRKVASLGHSEETRQKLSKIRKDYLSLHPEMVPYVLNHYSKGPSYAEKYFSNLLTSMGFKFIEQYSIGRYRLDFAFLDQKIDLEIDGEQHYLDPRIQKSDEERTSFLESEHWKVIRIRWSTYQSLSKCEKECFISNLLGTVIQWPEYSAFNR